LWIIVSQGDLKAYPGENAITQTLEQHGAKVARAVWDGTWNPAQFATAVTAIEAEQTPINYVALRKGTVVPPGQEDNGGGNHINTWRIAYTIAGVRDWLFAQHK
jgi:predicted peptidase